MKNALDYARQALRFAERVCDDVDAMRWRFDDAATAGRIAGARARPEAKRGYAIDARMCAGNAARFARRARAGGWWSEQYTIACAKNALQAAWCAGYAAAVSLPR